MGYNKKVETKRWVAMRTMFGSDTSEYWTGGKWTEDINKAEFYNSAEDTEQYIAHWKINDKGFTGVRYVAWEFECSLNGYAPGKVLA